MKRLVFLEINKTSLCPGEPSLEQCDQNPRDVRRCRLGGGHQGLLLLESRVRRHYLRTDEAAPAFAISRQRRKKRFLDKLDKN